MADTDTVPLEDDGVYEPTLDEYVKSPMPYQETLNAKMTKHILRFQELKQKIIEGRARQINGMVDQAAAAYVIWKSKLYRKLGTQSYRRMEDFLIELQHEKVDVSFGTSIKAQSGMGRARFFELVKHIDVMLKEPYKMSIEEAASYAIVHPGDIPLLIESGAATIEVKKVRGQKDYTLEFTDKGKDKLLGDGMKEPREYMRDLSEMPSSSDSRATIHHDAGTVSVWCPELVIYRATTPLFDYSQATVLAGQAQLVEPDNGSTNYLFELRFPSGTPNTVVEWGARRMRQEFRLNGETPE